MNNNYNNLYGDYTGATGTYLINDYIDITSNILEINSSNYTNITSNILKNYTNTNIINLDNKYKKLIKEETEDNSINTYITNSNLAGEIRFYINKPTELGIPNNSVIINSAGGLEIYYKYNGAINLLEQEGFKNIIYEIISSKASINLLGGFIGTLQVETASIITYLIRNRPQNELGELLEAPAFDNNSIYSQITSGLSIFLTRIQNTIFNNRYTLLLGSPIGAGIFAFAQYGADADAAHTIATAILNQYDSNLTLTTQEKEDLLDYGSNLYIDRFNSAMNNFSNVCVYNNFINSKIQIPQTIPSLNTSNINISINYNVGFPTIGINGGSGDKIILKSGSELNYPLSIGNDTNNLWLSTNNDINFYNKGVKTASITAAGDLLVSGDIMVNNKLLSDTYANNDQIYTYSNVYSVEREYPPKAYNYTSLEDIETILSQLSFHQNFYLDETGINYGSGYYEIFSSSKYDNQTTKDILFNFSTQSSFYASWGISIYNGATGNYSGDDTLDGQYYGDWIILKIPNNIILTRFRFYPRINFIGKAPAEFKCYGSIDGLIFTEIIEAQQLTRLTTANYSLGYYEKTLNISFNTEYNYIGFTFGKIVSTGFTDLNMAEIKLYGKEIIDKIIVDDVYTKPEKVKDVILNDTPQVCKHNAFYCQTSTVIYPNNGNTPYYKYDIDMRNYTQTGYIQIGSQSNDPYRIFRIRAFLGSCYFSSIKNGLPDILNYEIYMSFKANAASGGQGAAGVNIYAIGYPNNPTLNITPPNNIFILASPFNDFNYITLVSTSPADIRVIIEDLIS